jgi:acetyltransferase
VVLDVIEERDPHKTADLPITGLNATFASQMARRGNVGFISQSGALCTSILDWSLRENVGFSAFYLFGIDVGCGLGRFD